MNQRIKNKISAVYLFLENISSLMPFNFLVGRIPVSVCYFNAFPLKKSWDIDNDGYLFTFCAVYSILTQYFPFVKYEKFKMTEVKFYKNNLMS